MTNSAEKMGQSPPISSKLKIHLPCKIVVSPPTLDRPVKSLSQPSSRSTRKSSPLHRGFTWGLVVGTTALISAALGAGVTLMNPISQKIPVLKQSLPFSPQKVANFSLSPHPLTHPINILVLGVDRVLGVPPDSREALNGRSDTMLLLQFDPRDNTIKMLSIPRDSRVNIPRVGYTKINDANVYGGAELATEIVSQTLADVPIDRYIRITTDAFVELVDLVGGVEVFVPQDMYYRDQTQNLEIDLKAGLQNLNGEQAEQFARFRSNDKGDIGRVQRQQILLKALQKKIYSPAMLPRLPQAIEILQKQIDTDLSWEEMLSLASFGLELSQDSFKMVMLPGRFSLPHEYDGRSYWILDQENRVIQQIMANYFGVETENDLNTPRSPHRIRIALQNTTNDPTVIRTVRKHLRERDYTNIYVIDDFPQTLSETKIVVQQGDLDSAQQLQSSLGIGKVEASSTGDLGSDLTLRVGLDAKRLDFGGDFLKSVTSNQ